MAGVLGMFASIGDHIPVLKKEKFGEPHPEGEISRFHYRGTSMIIFAFSILVTSHEWISGTGSVISCLHKGPIPENVINTYCYIMGTFSVPKHFVDFDTQIGSNVAGTGVGPYVEKEDFIQIKAYYQWVPFVLFLQGMMFYLPHLIFKAVEGGKIKMVIAGLNHWVLESDSRYSKENELAKYMFYTRGTHYTWCLKVLFAQCLYLVNSVGQIFFTDCFLGWEFTLYGVSALSLLESKPEERVDPMSRVFPRMTKCTFKKYGPSGTVQRHDAQCILPINIINEKIYVFLWFWFITLSAVTFLNLIWAFGIVFFKRARKTIIIRKLKLSPRRQKLNVDIDLILYNMDIGDWKLFYHLLRNMDSLVFSEFCEKYTALLKREDLKRKGLDELVPMNTLYQPEEKPPSEQDFLTLANEGNYIKSKEADV